VTARRSGEGWSAQLPELGAVTAPSLEGLRARVHARIGDPDVRVAVQPKLPLELGRVVADTRAVREEAASLSARAEQLVQSTAVQLRGAGLSEGDIAVVLGLPEPVVPVVPTVPVRRPVGRPPKRVQSA
jgi:cation diffusion facilitator CzcD-associated flavoprotein CzcO